MGCSFLQVPYKNARMRKCFHIYEALPGKPAARAVNQALQPSVTDCAPHLIFACVPTQAPAPPPAEPLSRALSLMVAINRWVANTEMPFWSRQGLRGAIPGGWVASR